MFRVLRVISVLIVTIIAYLGVQYDFKSSGKLTDWGVFVILLTLVSGFTAIFIEVIEHRREKKEEEERRRQFTNLKFQLSKPILPLSVSYIFKHTPNQKFVNQIFGDRIKAFKNITNQYHHKAKFIAPDLLGFAFDENDENDYVVSKLTEDELRQVITDEKSPIRNLIRHPFAFELEFYKKNSTKCDLKMIAGTEGAITASHFLEEVRLYNTNIYQKVTTEDWRIYENSENLVSIYDLKGGKLIVKINFNSYDEEELYKPPYFTQIKLACGSRPYNLITLDKSTIGKPNVQNTFAGKVNMNEMFKKLIGNPVMLSYEIAIPDDNFEDFVQQFN